MKKLIIVILTIMMIWSLTGCEKEKELSDGEKFKQEYQQLNGQKDDKGNAYCEIEINENNKIMYVSQDKLIEGLENGTHIVYLGWPSCNWCRRLLPVLIDTVNEYSGIYIYYYNILADRNQFEESGDGFYLDIVNSLLKDDFDLSQYVSYYQDGTMKIPSSLILFIKDGEIIGVHKRTVESHLSAYEPLDENQIKELSDIYRWYLDILVTKDPIGCSEKCD